MIGLRPDNDGKSGLSQNKRSYKFAEKLSGRFFISGVSGSFQNHKRLLEIDDKMQKELISERKYSYEPLLERKKKEELMSDTRALLQMEQKLQEIRKRKEQRKRRDEMRQKSRLQYLSAKTVQHAFQMYLNRKRTNGTDIIVSFLRVSAAKQAISTAVWAIAIIKRCCKQYVRRFKQEQTVLRERRIAALDVWGLVTELACVWTLARRTVADICVHSCVQIAIGSVVAMQRPPETISQKVEPTKMRRQNSSINSNYRVANSHKQFFLTEFDNSDETVSGDGATEKDGSAQAAADRRLKNRKIGLTASKVIDTVASVSAAPLLVTNAGGVRVAKVFDMSDDKTRRIARLHQSRLDDMEVERLRRLENIEKFKASRKPRDVQTAEEEQKARLEAKLRFVAKLEEESRKQSRVILSKPAVEPSCSKVANKIQRAVVGAAQLYNSSVGSQSTPSTKNLDFVARERDKPVSGSGVSLVQTEKEILDTAPTISRKKVTHVKQQEIESMAEQLRELEQQRFAKFNSEDALRRSRAAVQRRVASKLALDSLHSVEEEKAEVVRKENLKLVAEEARRKLHQALLIRKKKRRLVRQKVATKMSHLDSSVREAEGVVHDGTELLGAENDDHEKFSSFVEADDRLSTALQSNEIALRHVISSAKEDYSEVLEDFRAEDFFSRQKSLIQLYAAPPPPEFRTGQSSFSNKSDKLVGAAVTKVLPRIPKALRDTPYFVDYEKHTHQQAPLKKLTKQYEMDQQFTSIEASPISQCQQKSSGRVASLMDMVARARKKLGGECVVVDNCASTATDSSQQSSSGLKVATTVGASSLSVLPSAHESESATRLPNAPSLPNFRMLNMPSAIPLPPMRGADLHLLQSSSKTKKHNANGKKRIKKRDIATTVLVDDEEEESFLSAQCDGLRRDLARKLIDVTKLSISLFDGTLQSEAAPADNASNEHHNKVDVRVSAQQLLQELELAESERNEEEALGQLDIGVSNNPHISFDDDLCSRLLVDLAAKINNK